MCGSLRARRCCPSSASTFWLNLVGIVAAILNAFVHSRDAYAIVPENVILSVITVALLGIAQLMLAGNKFVVKGGSHE